MRARWFLLAALAAFLTGCGSSTVAGSDSITVTETRVIAGRVHVQYVAQGADGKPTHEKLHVWMAWVGYEDPVEVSSHEDSGFQTVLAYEREFPIGKQYRLSAWLRKDDGTIVMFGSNTVALTSQSDSPEVYLPVDVRN